jgi:glycosyltransferase involved in cell wall biosynthesis
MNILVVNWQDWRNEYAGGAEVYLYEIFGRLIRKGHRVLILCSRGKGQARRETIDGFEIFRIGGRQNFNFLTPFGLRALLRHHRIDVVIDDLNKIPFYSPLFTRRRVLGMPMHLFREAIYKETNPLLASYVYLAERLIPYFYRRDPFIAISRSTFDDLRDMGLKTPIHIVRSGTSRPPKMPETVRDRNLVAYVGRVKSYKSIDHFLRAAALVRGQRPIEVMIVGDGDARQSLEELARDLSLPAVFTGFVDENEKYRIYARARIVVQPSIKEGWGLTAVEAQACGTPVVCADSPGLREVVDKGKSGFLYPYGDIPRFAQRIRELLDDDRKWRESSSAAARWADSFSWDRAAREMEAILSSGSEKIQA